MKALLCDINVILDIFLKREPFYQASANLFQLIEEGRIKGYLCALSFPIIYYLLYRELSRDESLRILEKIRIVFDVAKVDARNIDLALASNFNDFEDAVQIILQWTLRWIALFQGTKRISLRMEFRFSPQMNS